MMYKLVPLTSRSVDTCRKLSFSVPRSCEMNLHASCCQAGFVRVEQATMWGARPDHGFTEWTGPVLRCRREGVYGVRSQAMTLHQLLTYNNTIKHAEEVEQSSAARRGPRSKRDSAKVSATVRPSRPFAPCRPLLLLDRGMEGNRPFQATRHRRGYSGGRDAGVESRSRPESRPFRRPVRSAKRQEHVSAVSVCEDDRLMPEPSSLVLLLVLCIRSR